jgi:hypothetical protein
MILYKNICDFCGNEEEIVQECGSFVLHFTVLSAYDQVVDGKRHSMKPYEASFCRRECLEEWIKANLTKNGMVINNDV